MSKAGANFALNDLLKANLINRQQKGKTYLYTINDENPVVKVKNTKNHNESHAAY